MYAQLSKNRSKKTLIFESDPIHEEIEIEDDEAFSENNFYITWKNRRRYLLTHDEQLAVLQDDSKSVTAFNQDRKNRLGRINRGRGKKKDRGKNIGEKDKVELDPIEEKIEDHLKNEE